MDKITAKIKPLKQIQSTLYKATISTGTDNYELLSNHPFINSIEVTGKKTLHDYGIQEEINKITNMDIENLFKKKKET